MIHSNLARARFKRHLSRVDDTAPLIYRRKPLSWLIPICLGAVFVLIVIQGMV